MDEYVGENEDDDVDGYNVEGQDEYASKDKHNPTEVVMANRRCAGWQASTNASLCWAGNLFQNDPKDGGLVDAGAWKDSFVEPGNRGLHLTLQNALDETWQRTSLLPSVED